jgi:hypothetical protein
VFWNRTEQDGTAEHLEIKMDNFTRAMSYIKKLPEAISGSGGHNATLRAACECVRFGLSESEIQDAMNWYNENKCQPEWEPHELAHKIKTAQDKAQRGARVNVANKSSKRLVFVPPDMAKRGY